MEAAGLVLGVYPAVVLAFQQYKQGYKYCQNWIRFRRRYEDFIHDTAGQQLFLEGILQDIMCNGPRPFLTEIESKDDFVKIVRSGSYTGWRDPRLKLALTSRLGDKYDWCMYQIERIYGILAELEQVLDVQALSTSDKSPDWWRLQWERLKQSLSEARYEDLKEARRLISELKEMVVSCDGSQQAQESSSKLAPFFAKVRDNALSIHTVLKNGWHCCCSTTHKAMLQLERRVDDRESEFNVLLQIPSAQPSGATKAATSTIYIQQETCITISPTILEKENDEREVEQDEGRDNIFSGGSAKCSTGHSFSESSRRHSATLSSQSDDDEHDIWAAVHAWKSRLKQLKPLGKNRAKPTIHYAESKHFIESNRRQFIISTGLKEKGGLVATLETVSITDMIPDSLSTAFINPTKQQADSHPITDLCHFIHKPLGPWLGYLMDPKNQRHSLTPKKPTYITHGGLNIITLNDLLEGGSYRFPPAKRAVVATILASSLLQLQHTHWLKDSWDKRDIFFVVSNDEKRSVVYEQPYVSQEFLATKPFSKSESTAKDEMETPSKFQLQIALQCLAILLLELCIGEPIEQGKDRVRLQPIDTNDQAIHEYYLAIARTWSEDEINDHEPGFFDPIVSCLNFPGVGRAKRGQFDQVVEDIYSLIAKPLYDMTTKKWPNSFSYRACSY